MPRYLYESHLAHERQLDPRNYRSSHHLRHPTLHSPNRFHHCRLPPALSQYMSLSDPTTTSMPMNREVHDLVLLFTSAFVGATIAFLTALITFTFHHKIRERLILQGLIVPPNEPQQPNPAEIRREPREGDQGEGDNQPRPVPLYILERAGHVPGFPVVRLPPNYNPENNPNRHLRLGNFPAAFTAWRN